MKYRTNILIIKEKLLEFELAINLGPKLSKKQMHYLLQMILHIVMKLDAKPNKYSLKSNKISNVNENTL